MTKAGEQNISYQTCPVNESFPPANISQGLPLLYKYSGQARAFLKIQDGCDAYCTYCIIPKIRTKVCNKAVKDVILEARNLINDSHREIVLTGIFVGAYGQATARRRRWETKRIYSLAKLLDQTANVNGLERVNPAQGLCGRYFTVDVSTLPEAKTFKIGQIVADFFVHR